MTEPKWMLRAVVEAIHDSQLAEHGGAPGLRDSGLLDSALARCQQAYRYGDPDLFEIAAALAGGLVRNHPFVDGNKRTAFVSALVFLRINGLAFTAAEAEATLAVQALASGDMEESTFAQWLRDNATPL